MQRHGWSLLFHGCLIEQLQKLKIASDRAEASDPLNFAANVHGNDVVTNDRTRHARFPHLNPLPLAGEEANESLREFKVNANVKLYRALSHLIFEIVPSDPAREEYRQGNTMGTAYRHWRRAKIGRRFRLFFRYDSKAKVIVFAWVNDEHTLRSAGSKSDPYAIFQKMLDRGNPPDDWPALLAACQTDWSDNPL